MSFQICCASDYFTISSKFEDFIRRGGGGVLKHLDLIQIPIEWYLVFKVFIKE